MNLENIYSPHISNCQQNTEAKFVFEAVYPRRFRTPQGYCNPKYLCARLVTRADLIPADLDGPLPQRVSRIESWAASEIVNSLVDHDAPTYFLAQDFGEAIWRSSVNESLRFDDFQFASRSG